MKTYNFLIVVSVLAMLTSCSSSKYVNYLKQNTERVDMTDSLQFSSLDDEFYNNDLFFVGEIHEVETSPRIDFAMFTQLNNKVNVQIYLAEMDIAQAYYLQKYIEGSNEIALKDILKNWAVYIGSISEQYRHKWVKLRAYYAQLPEGSKFKIVGLDKIADYALLRKLVQEKIPEQYLTQLPTEDNGWIAWSTDQLDQIINSGVVEHTDIALLKDLQFNIQTNAEIKSRDHFMYQNFKRYYLNKEWKNKKIYGGFGFAHTLQAYDYTLAGRIKKDSTLLYTHKMVSMNALYVDSRLTVQSASLPKFLQDKGKDFTRFKFSYDNRLFMYIKGIADYKKVTKPNTINLIKLDSENSPYLYTARGTKTKRLLPIWEGFDIIEGTATTDYAQFVFLIRNADWVVPDAK
ncbi:hypothetical protein [Croceivirga sp. JEA036]|uniref:hypothetical protein n=1 Tax=Croceivirga sp. JEA036 TaxID=2721162 RepID=UPI00143B6BEF|nr:hypothetical protein [Croceivirga sp. JEA036]NJB35289.1 hypothetical protein [Croceivirga sp. JEA036]